MSRTLQIVASLALLTSVGVTGACWPHVGSTAVQRQYETYYVLATMRGLVDSFTHVEGRPPRSLPEACLHLRPNLPYYEGRLCQYWLHHGDTLPVDGWRRVLEYEATEAGVVLRSAGADGIFGTLDDIGFDLAAERRRVTKAAGCYRVDFRDWKQFSDSLIRLDTTYVGHGWYQAAPAAWYYFPPRWQPSPYSSGADSISVVWQEVHSRVQLDFTVFGDSLVGSASGRHFRNRRVVAHHIDCPPEQSA